MKIFKKVTVRVMRMAAIVLPLLLLLTGVDASAEYNRITESAIDVRVFKVDEKKFLGSRVNGDFLFTNADGVEFRLKELMGKPLVILFSYFNCDGVCSTVNAEFRQLLKGVDRMDIGKEYNVLTVSFDKYDTPETLNMFRKELDLSDEMAKGWTLARMNDPEDIKKLTDGIGYKFFWSPRDRMFFHPNVYVLVSPKGRVARYLYASTIDSNDVEIALLETGSELIKPGKVIDLLVSYCYSYNFKEGKYTYNIPLFIAVGSLTIGVTSFFVSAMVFKRRLNNKKGEIS